MTDHRSSPNSSFPMPPPASAAPLDGQCPTCFKRFASDSSTLRHMNNPWTSCLTWFDYLESVSPPSARTLTDGPDHDETSHNGSPPRDNGTTCDDEPGDNPAPAQYEDTHPNIPFVFGSRQGFIDTFNSDGFAEKRKHNLYFLFSSKEEWGFSLWLSRSGLSMRAIDDLLALPIVRPNQVTTISLLTKFQDSVALPFLHNRKDAA